jgi:hypothetical protein
MRKNYYLMDNVGSTKYTVNFHDGVKTHKDGSPFYDIQLFKNKKKRDAFVKELCKTGYMERNLIPQTS